MIDDADDEVNLTSDYVYVGGDDDVVVSKSIRVRGNDHSIENDGCHFAIDANDSNVIFENVRFSDNQFNINPNCSSLNVTFINCAISFKNQADSSVNIYDVSITGEISLNVKQVAVSIVGKSTDLEAAKKLANWVGKNIKHETAPGFYQTPDMTLLRKMGNCCSQTDLFLQMCVAIGLDKNHRLYYVHVGTMKFGKRHFFAAIDNILVDVDAMPNSPWGHANIGNRDVYRVTEYPYLPLPRQY